MVGLIVVGIGVSFGANAGYASNPARDLGPRILAWIEGWKSVAIPGDYGKIEEAAETAVDEPGGAAQT